MPTDAIIFNLHEMGVSAPTFYSHLAQVHMENNRRMAKGLLPIILIHHVRPKDTRALIQQLRHPDNKVAFELDEQGRLKTIGGMVYLASHAFKCTESQLIMKAMKTAQHMQLQASASSEAMSDAMIIFPIHFIYIKSIHLKKSHSSQEIEELHPEIVKTINDHDIEIRDWEQTKNFTELFLKKKKTVFTMLIERGLFAKSLKQKGCDKKQHLCCSSVEQTLKKAQELILGPSYMSNFKGT